MRRNTIIYFMQLWDINIGNAFTDIGVLISLNKVINRRRNILLLQTGTLHSSLDFLSITQKLTPVARPFWRFFGKYLGRDFLDKRYSLVKPDGFNLAEFIKADYVFFSGCIFTVIYLRTKERLLKKLKEKGVKVIFYGAGGNTYSGFEINYVREKLKSIRPYAIFTRDSFAFDNYSDLSDYAFDGIEPGFYLSELSYLKNVELDFAPYVVLTFDKLENKDIKKKLEREFRTKYTIVKLSHIPYSDRALFIDTPPKSCFTSESPYDYILLYSNAEEVHTDRVHACVVSLAFDIPCKLYNKTPRARLLEKVCVRSAGDTLRLKNADELIKLEEKQVNELFRILEE